MVALLRKPDALPSSGARTAARLGLNLKQLRRERKLTLDQLALKSGVSRAMISKIERGAAVPTATVLGKLALGLETGLSQLVGGYQERGPLLLRPNEQALFRDPESGLERRSLSPLFSDRTVDFAFNTLPARVGVSFPPHPLGVEEYLYVSEGELTVIVGAEQFEVRKGSSLFYHAHVVHEFHNKGDAEAQFFIVVDSTASR
jgi:transcriptional regulator with XRE-family HTH domain